MSDQAEPVRGTLGATRDFPTTFASGHDLAPLRVPRWAWLLAAGALLVVYIVGFENGAIFGDAADYVHEFFHNSRHFAAFPCH